MRTDTLPGRVYAPDIDGRARRLRADRLPEKTAYRDTGCEVAPACLSCPLAVCKDDTGLATQRMALRNSVIRRLNGEGMSAEDLALLFDVHIRTIFKALTEAV